MTTSKANCSSSLDGLLAAVGLHDLEAALGQTLGHQRPERRLVVDEER